MRPNLLRAKALEDVTAVGVGVRPQYCVFKYVKFIHPFNRVDGAAPT